MTGQGVAARGYSTGCGHAWVQRYGDYSGAGRPETTAGEDATAMAENEPGNE
jgi:hypothetical protein